MSQASALGTLRLVQGIDVLADQHHVWVRGNVLSSDLLRRIRTVPDAELFARRSGDQLSFWEATVPCERLPDGSWQPLAKWLELEFPRAGFAGRTTSKMALTLARAATMSMSNVIATAWSVWKQFATTAPSVRLNPLSFAVSSELQVLILGTPLPPLSGQTLVEESGVIVPSGWRFEPELSHRAVADVLGLSPDDYALFEQDGSFTRIARSSFVKATRSAVRASDG